MRGAYSGVFIFVLGSSFLTCSSAVRYEPNWNSLDSRPLPPWYDESKIGIFLHWGVFSVPSFINEWFWYVVLVTKHHEGFTNWPSKYSWNWNAMDVGPNRDLVGELAAAIREKTDIHFGVYHSLFEWFNPLFEEDQRNNFTTQNFVFTKTMPELYELVNTYKPEIVWSDGDWMVEDTYWNATHFLAWLYNDSPVKDTVVVNDRWGSNIRCHHGGFWNCDDRFVPGHLIPHKWENSMTLDKYSWGYRRNARLSDIYSMDEFIALLVKTVSLGGNILVNVGPTKDGMISPIYEERLTQMGEWLGVNGDAIFGTQPWKYQNDTVNSNVWYTAKKANASTVVYAIILKWPSTSTMMLGAPSVSSKTKISLLGYNGAFTFTSTGTQGVAIDIPPIPFYQMPCQWGWAFQLDNLNNQ
ncbi:hypothetical protein C0Q70_01645 [Pomacea canaliculata]|uniref:alpha-L-fucosidase n=1 Tax=Pomacea canaliculata TaxID=400727 RepID=A0A2T7Q024_POMCA|nr:hypothetical protein C0Q70_01645 [Pomacea canaliculata]